MKQKVYFYANSRNWNTFLKRMNAIAEAYECSDPEDTPIFGYNDHLPLDLLKSKFGDVRQDKPLYLHVVEIEESSLSTPAHAFGLYADYCVEIILSDLIEQTQQVGSKRVQLINKNTGEWLSIERFLKNIHRGDNT